MKKTTISGMVWIMVFLFVPTVFALGLKGDLNNDGDVDGRDLAIFSKNFGKTEDACTGNDNCIDGYYCAKRTGDCDGVGRCSLRPEACIEIYDPVCGCNGETYSNACFAQAAGVNVLHPGACELPEQFELGEIFRLTYQQVKANTEENLKIKFEGVPLDNRCPLDVVCVWEGNAEVELTFSKNNFSRSFVLNTGLDPRKITLFGYEIALIKLEPTVLSSRLPDQEDYIAYLHITKSNNNCRDNNECTDDSYCAKAPGDCESAGSCMPRPTACYEIYNPVCGCNGVTYGNDCYANAAGTNIAFKGICRSSICDDGTPVLCSMIPPKCGELEILSIQNRCWLCVNPKTCKPWGESGCEDDADCPPPMECDFCGTSSCPSCDDCVPACVCPLD